MIVNYQDIEKIISQLESDLEKYEKEFAKNQSLFLEVLQTQMFPLLAKEQKELLMFICTAIYFAVSSKTKSELDFDLDEFMEAEEANWSIKEQSNDWADCLNIYFEKYPEEDLLAFVEDMTSPGDDHQINDSDVEIILITCKSYIDQFELNAD